MATEAVPARSSEHRAASSTTTTSRAADPPSDTPSDRPLAARTDTAVEGNPDAGAQPGGGGGQPGTGQGNGGGTATPDPVTTTPGDGSGQVPGPVGPGAGAGSGSTTTPPAGGGGTPTPTPDPTGDPPTGDPPAGPGGDTTGPDPVVGTPPVTAPIDPPSRPDRTPERHVTLPPPPPGGGSGPGPTLDTLSVIEAARIPTDELLDRSRNTINQALGAGAAAGGGPAGAGIIMRLLETALRRDEHGLTVFDAKELSLVEERRRLEAELRRRGAAPDLVQRLLSNIIEQGQVQREREKIEGLLALMVSICFGNIPKGLVNRLVELGLGPEVQRAMQEAIGNGRHLSRGAIRDLMSLAQSGLGLGVGAMPDVGTAPEHQVEDYYRDEDRRIARAATATGGARMLDPRRVPADAEPSQLTEALRARMVSSGWGSAASTG